MSAEEIIKFNVVYDVRGIDSSIRQSQRLLYFMNAVRLSVTDLQQVMSGPTIANVMWTAVQLTRVWTTAYRWVRMTNEAQRVGMAQSVVGGVGRGVGRGIGRATGIMGVNQAMSSLFDPNYSLPPPSLWAMAMASLSNPYVAASLVGLAIMGGAIAWDRNEKLKYNEHIKRNREVAKSQGFEW